MLATFSETVAGWQNFYLMAGSASATLIGLLFVAVSLHIDVLAEPTASAILLKARRTFSRFIVIVVIALMFMVPEQSARGLGLPLLALGIVDALRTARLVQLAWRERKERHAMFGMDDASLLSLAFPLVSSTLMTIVAATILAGHTAYLSYMIGVIAVILTGAANDSWNLMLNLAKAKHALAAAKAASAAGHGG